MNVEYLKYFVVLSKVQHYGKAAKLLNISQPGLSHAMKALEEEYGVPLFQKEGRNVNLSLYGREIQKDVEKILESLDRLDELAADFRSEEKTVRIASVYPFAAGRIPKMLREFGATFPFVIYNRMTPEIMEGLEDGKYDIGFCSELLKSEKLEYHPIRYSYIAAVVPKGHELEQRENPTLEELSRYPQVLFAKTSGFRSLQEQLFADAKIQIKAACSAEELEIVIGMVEQGFGISVLPYMDIVQPHNVTAIPLETTAWESCFYIARKKHGIRSAQEEAFFQYCMKNGVRG